MQDELMPLPIIPKSKFEFRLPPKCPLSEVTFMQIPQLAMHPETKQQMGLGYDLVEASARE
jgi:hypothetical protein